MKRFLRREQLRWWPSLPGLMLMLFFSAQVEGALNTPESASRTPASVPQPIRSKSETPHLPALGALPSTKEASGALPQTRSRSASASQSATQEQPITQRATTPKRGIEVSGSLLATEDAPGDLSGKLRIDNYGPLPVLLEHVFARFTGTLGKLYGWTAPAIPDQHLVVKPGESLTLPMEFKAPDKAQPLVLTRLKSGPAEMAVEVTYSEPERNATTSMFEVEVTVHTNSSLVVLGAVAGACLLVLFSAFTKLVNGISKNTIDLTNKTGWTYLASKLPKWGSLLLVFGLNGALVGVLLLILSSVLTGLSLPVSFKLEDFGGGLIVGLFSAPIGKSLAEKLTLL